jgi:hypothetical protein
MFFIVWKRLRPASLLCLGTSSRLIPPKKIVRKLSGKAQGTAVWCSNIGNEYGQVLTSVLTAAEGSGLATLIDGIIQRYKMVHVQPLVIVYTDRDCCGGSQLSRMLSAWDTTVLWLDIWHFMRRISTGLTTDSHQLYGSIMDSLSNCIFEWDKTDLNLLIKVNTKLLESQTAQAMTEADVKRRISRTELSCHCQRRTRGEEVTKALTDQLISSYSGPGVSLDRIKVHAAQWPDCNHYTEWVILELLRIFPRDIRKSTQKMTRFGLVLLAYSCFRECVLNHIVMRDTEIQLPDINKGTLSTQ